MGGNNDEKLRLKSTSCVSNLTNPDMADTTCDQVGENTERRPAKFILAGCIHDFPYALVPSTSVRLSSPVTISYPQRYQFNRNEC